MVSYRYSWLRSAIAHNQTMQADGQTCHSNCYAISAPGLPAIDGGVSVLGEIVLDTLLIECIPSFKEHWDKEDIYKEEDGTFTPHGVMGSFLEFFQHNSQLLSRVEVAELCQFFEKTVSSDPEDNDSNSNAICTMFLELLVDTEAGNIIEPYLGQSCKEYWNCYK